MNDDGLKVPITERALAARMRRRLALDGKTLHKCRKDSRSWETLGDWYVTDQNNYICDYGFKTLEEYARMGCPDVLRDYERVVY